MTRIRNEDITLVFQGQWLESTAGNIARARAALPGVQILLSTFAADHTGAGAALCDRVVRSHDPGPLAPCMRGSNARANNLNRQIVTSAAGLEQVSTRYAAKIRTDCTLVSRNFAELYEHIDALDFAGDRLLASSFYTLHPEGLEQLQFHVSDWFIFGKTETLQTYFDVRLMSRSDAEWFDWHPYEKGSSHIARRYRARYSPEQYLAVAYAQKTGNYSVPDYLNHSTEAVMQDCMRLIAEKFIVFDPDFIGLGIEKYRHVGCSNYQFFNCVWGSDWLDFCEQKKTLISNNPGENILFEAALQGPSSGRRRAAADFMKKINHAIPLLRSGKMMPLVGKMLGLYRHVYS
ncbi:WavE lipopolysaccharide synthesis family protein [Paraburkholderia bonniea]|uniref:WavE lipopolysaccharide synthesis family protein n=1 Tax=Paraburkholderia bonniea TaxID=2152891 RepID=UPI001290C661|nr:WavE lipopolysaccharide synthesis family protein [Paraburkholderia bonniea]WJF90814.1 WavE lipopolysaccharide synthesis family protein [Paraburkholderia bonniea]WJF94128.1 WavE lipopolysaccharide synthesis family protein [Paraburkholderia bonniea]